MNKVFMKKIMQAKKLEYEALKEIMPEKMKTRIDSFGKEAFELIKDIAFEMIKEDIDEKNDTTDKSDPDYNNESASKSKTVYKRTKKVSIDFN